MCKKPWYIEYNDWWKLGTREGHATVGCFTVKWTWVCVSADVCVEAVDTGSYIGIQCCGGSRERERERRSEWLESATVPVRLSEATSQQLSRPPLSTSLPTPTPPAGLATTHWVSWLHPKPPCAHWHQARSSESVGLCGDDRASLHQRISSWRHRISTLLCWPPFYCAIKFGGFHRLPL